MKVLLSVGQRRPAVVLAVAAIAVALLVVPVGPAGAHHLPIHSEPSIAQRFDVGAWEEAGSWFSYRYTWGSDARCGADRLGDGWECTAEHQPNTVEFNASPPHSWYLQGWHERMTAGLYLDGVLVAERTSVCPSANWGNWCHSGKKADAASDYWTTWQTTAGGALSGRITVEYRNSSNVPLTWTATVALPTHLSAIRTATQVENQAPNAIGLRVPDLENLSLDNPNPHRRDPEHLQEFAALFNDNDGHNLAGRLRIYGPDTTVDCADPDGEQMVAAYDWNFLKSNPLTWPTGSHPVEVLSPPLALPHANGLYTACLDAKDTSGWANAQGPAQAFTFNYTWNTAPIDAIQVLPSPQPERAALNRFRAGVPVAFVAEATDPENDVLTIRTVIDGAKTYESIPTRSGREAVTIIHDGLTEGEHFAEVGGDDIHDARGILGARLSFTAVNPSTMVPVNQPPTAPFLVAPVHGGLLPAGAAQEFVVRASDPEGDPWRAVIEVQDANGAPVTKFATDESASGTTATGRPLAPIGPAEGYQWRATALDSRGALGPSSGWQSFSVQGGDGEVVSDDCAAGTTVAQMTAGGHYAHLQTAGSDICWRVDGPTVGAGGKLTVVLPGGGTPTPSVDENTGACSTTLLAGTVGDPSDPATYLPYRLATATGPSEAAVCVDVGGQHRRMALRFPGAGTPTVTPAFDPLGDQSHPLSVDPALPSSICVGKPGATSHAAASGPLLAHLTTWAETPTRLHVCVRAHSAAGAGGPHVGGRFTLDTTASPGISPSITTSTDFGPCTLGVVNNTSPVRVEVRRSSSTNPVSVCLNLAGAPLRITAGATGALTRPTATWSPDPGTPGL
jgi:hypothetical protein